MLDQLIIPGSTELNDVTVEEVRLVQEYQSLPDEATRNTDGL